MLWLCSLEGELFQSCRAVLGQSSSCLVALGYQRPLHSVFSSVGTAERAAEGDTATMCLSAECCFCPCTTFEEFVYGFIMKVTELLCGVTEGSAAA